MRGRRSRADVGIVGMLLLLGLGSTDSLFAQAARSTIQGTVSDQAGAILADSAIEVTNVATGVPVSLTTNAEGRYTVADLPPGEYQVRASRSGFRSVLREGVTLQVGALITVDFDLPSGPFQETLTVIGEVPVIDTLSSAIGAVVDQHQLASLPLNGRSLFSLMAMAPGVTEIPFGAAGGGALFGRQTNITVAGARADGQVFLLDGTNVQGFWDRAPGVGALGTTLGVDAIAEFQVLSHTYGAQFGGNGAAVNIVSQSGTNRLRGSAFEYYRNSGMDARNYFDVLGKQPFERHQFGASLGGPLRRNKVFYFVNYEGIQQEQTDTRIAFVPDQDARNGIINGVAVGIHPAIRPVLELYPTASSSRGDGVGQVPQVASSDGGQNYVLGRVDYTLTPSHSLFGRYVSDTANFFDPWSGSNIPSWGARSRTNNQYLTIEERSTLSASLANQVRIGIVRDREMSRTTGSTLPLDFFPGEGRQNGLIQVTSLTNIGASIVLPVDLALDRVEVADDVYWTRGHHSFKLGGGIRWTRSTMDVPFLAGGAWVFSSVQSLLLNFPITAVGALSQADDARRTVRELSYVAYVQDDWRIGRKLTLNLGLRYNPLAIPSIEGEDGATTLKDPPYSPFESVDHVFASNPSLKNLDPRVGFAYTPFADNRTSVRGGFGVFHNPIAPRVSLPYYVNNPPFKTAQQYFFPLTSVFSTFPVLFASNSNSTPLSVTQGLDYNTTKTPYVMQWNVNVERELFPLTGVMVAYAGSRGENLLRQRDTNPVTPATLADGTVIYGIAHPNIPAIISNPAVNSAFGRLTINYADAWSEYHALEVSVNRRVHRGVQAQLAYTLSKCTDLSSGVFGGEGSTPATNPYDAEYDRGPCYFDRRHVLNANGSWTLPFTGNAFVNGWQLAAVVRASSGRPFTPGIGFSQSGLQGQAPERPNLAPGRTLDEAYTGNPQQWFNPTVFALPAAGTLGTVGRHVLRAPAQNTVDCAVSKNLDFGKNRVQLRLEAFNVFNHTNFGLPNPSIFVPAANGGGTYSPTAGQITQSGPARQLQVSARYTF